MSHSGHHLASLVVTKSIVDVSTRLERIRQSWDLLLMHLEPAAVDSETNYMKEWLENTGGFIEHAFDKFGLHLSESKYVFATEEWNYIDRYLGGIMFASGPSKQYKTPSLLPFIGEVNDEFEGVKRYSTLMIRIRLFHISHLILRPPDVSIPSIGLRGGPINVMERYVQVKADSNLPQKIESVFAAIKRVHHTLELHEQVELESDLMQLENFVRVKRCSIHHFEEIVRQNEKYAEWLAHKASENQYHHPLRERKPEPPTPVLYLSLLGRLLHEHSQHLAQHAVHPPAHAEQSLAHGASSHLTHRQCAIYDKV